LAEAEGEEAAAREMAAGGRVSIPVGARRTVADIKEIAGGHTDEEVYAMLRECNMDPNETAQRLLLQDTFHEVKRKRDKKKEGSKEPLDSRWRPALQGRGGKSGRGNYSSRSLSSSNGIYSILQHKIWRKALDATLFH
jgi:hypothetical protein